jgi:hypothetical protein
MWPRNLAPDNPNLGSANFLLATVDVCDALAVVEGSSLTVVDTLDFDERGARVRVALAALVGEVLAPEKKYNVSALLLMLSLDRNIVPPRHMVVAARGVTEFMRFLTN